MLGKERVNVLTKAVGCLDEFNLLGKKHHSRPRMKSALVALLDTFHHNNSLPTVDIFFFQSPRQLFYINI